MRAKVSILFCILILTACQSAPFPASFEGEVDLGDYALELICAGEGEPTILLENSLTYFFDSYSWNSRDVERFSTIARTCTYHHYVPPVAEKQARTSLDQVKDLHQLLKKAGVPGPFILVGHGTAAWNLVLYTQKYPNEVAGLVCIDCVAPGVWRVVVERAEAENITIPEEDRYFLDSLSDYTNNREHLLMDKSSLLAEEVDSLGNRPVVVLDAALTPDSGLLESVWVEKNEAMCNLSSQCRYAQLEGASETSILLNEAVDQAVTEVFQAVK